MTEWRKITVSVYFITAILLLSGCASGNKTLLADKHANGKGKQLAAISRELIGAPYRYGGESPGGFDCSGLVRYVYRQIGITVPHSSRLLYQQAKRVHLGNLQPGDLLFFRISEKKISHVGIYTSDRQFIHAPSSGKKVSIAHIDSLYWEKRLIAAGRFY